MERLTYKVHDGGIFVKESDVKTFDVEDEIMHTGNAIRKLAGYEDLEEQGLLLKLPCKKGELVYKHFRQRDNFDDIPHTIVTTVRFDYSMIDEIGKTVFLTQSEAEEALKEMQREDKK